MEEQTLFSWIHLSDIHVGHGDRSHGWNQMLVMEALRRDVAARPGPARVDWVLVTGDVAFSGAGRSPDEYTKAGDWLREVAAAAGIDPGWIFLVPGNHDVNRAADKVNAVRRLVDDVRAGGEALDAALASPEDRPNLAKRMSAYLEFARGFAPWCQEPAVPEADQRLFWMRRVRVSETLRVRLVGLNTAILSKDDTDQGKLQLGNEQLAAALIPPIADEGELVIGLSHHPLTSGWLSDQKEVYGWIRNNAHIHLSGHVHEAESGELRSGSGGQFVHVVAGAVHNEKMPKDVPASHGYNYGEIVHVGGGTLELRVWPRRWSEANKEFRLDVDSVPNGKPYASHRLRARLPGATATAAPSGTTGGAPAAPSATAAAAPSVTTTAAATMAPVSAAPTTVAPASAAPASEPAEPVDIFYFYSPEDEEMRKEIDKHLALLKHQGLIKAYRKQSVALGATKSATVRAEVDSARIFLSLVSASFFADDVFEGPEMKRAMERADAGEALMIPILLRPCDWEETRLYDFQGLPRDGVPVSKHNRDEALTDVAFEIRSLVKSMKKR